MPIFRFAPEMNIPDVPWYGNATGFIYAWKNIYNAIHAAGLTQTYMYWCPNIAYSSLPANTYDVYYPGDSVVDIVGVDIYWFGNDKNLVDSPTDFESQMTGVTWKKPNWNFYQNYSVARNKPIVIGET